LIIRNIKDQGHQFEIFGVQHRVLLPREETECTEVVLEKYPPGVEFPLNSHEEMEQLYYILRGRGLMTIDDEQAEVKMGDLVLIPRRAQHAIKNIGEEEMSYLCFDLFPEGYPEGEETWAGHERAIWQKFGR